MTDKVTVGADLVRQAAKLLNACREPRDAVMEVVFDADKEEIQVWDNLADREILLGTAAYD